MTTSLAAQLQKLAVPQTSLLERDKKRPSLLFDPKEAAAIDRDTFYDIGISGLRDLKALDGDFAYFENNLFSSTSRTVERAVQDKETNKNLDKTIKKFFITLSPYFLLKPAHKALEWLIHRFSIHEYNKKDFLKLIFPYHETNIFVRCLRLFNFKNKNDGWNWLYPLQKSGVHLPKITLYNHCSSDVGFLTIISKTVLEAVKEKKSKANSLTTLFTFYCTTTIGTLENVEEVSEPLLTAILPALLNGLLSDVPDYAAATYMVTAVLLKKTQLSHDLLNTLVARLSSTEQKLLRMEAALVMLLVYQAQREHYNVVTDKVTRNLANADWFAGNVGALAASGSYVLPLLSPVLRAALLKSRADKYRRLVEKLFAEIHLNDASVDTLIRIVLDSCPTSENHDDTSSEEEEEEEDISEQASSISALEWYASFLKQLETQYPNAFDKIIREVLSGKTSTSKRQAEALKHIMTFAMTKTKNSRYTIFEKLYHPNADFRHTAVEFLVKKFHSLSVKDKEMMQGAVTERILDDDCRVVKSILKLQHNDLINLLGENNFIPIAVKLLTKGIKDEKYYEIIPYLIKHVCYGEISKNSSLLLPILPFLFPVDEKELDVSKKILQTDFCKHYAFLTKNLNKNFKTPKEFCETIYQNLLKNNTNFELAKFPNDILNIHKYLGCILVVSNLPKVSSADLAIKALQQIGSYLSQCKVMKVKGFNVAECVSYARNECLPLEGFLECVKIILTKTECSEIPSTWLPLSSRNQTVNFLINLMVLIVKGCHHDDKRTVKYYSVLFKTFMDKFFTSFKQKVNFLANFLLCDDNTNQIINSKTQLRIIKILNSLLLQTKKEPITWTVEFRNEVVVPAVLIGLINPLQEIRMAVFEIIDLLSNLDCNNINESYIPLLQELSEHKQEIILDSEQLPLILFSLLESSTAKISINVLCNMISEVNLPLHVNSRLLKVLTFINSNVILEKTTKVATHVLKTANNKNIILDFHQSYIVYNVILRFSEKRANGIKLESCSLEFMNLALQQDLVSLEYEQNKYSCPSVLILSQINEEFFNKLSFDVQKELIKILTNIATVSENPDVVSCTYKIVKKLDMDAKLLIDALTIMQDVKSSKKNVPLRKFRRVTEIPTADILDMIEWKQGITVLEFIQDKKKLTNSNLLLPVLFGVLKKCLDFDEQAAVEYPKQIILTAILYICNKMETEGTKINLTCSSFNMELVVQCIRASQNPQTHHHALLLLAHTAALLPDQVLHNIMAIFTFMGSSVLRHDDAYSFQIISKIIDTIIPILVHQDNTESVAAVLRVFVDVVLDIPEHRRLPLFKKLLVTLGVQEYMWLFLLLIFESHVVHGNDVMSKETTDNRLLMNVESTTKRLDIASNITLEFEPDVILNTTIKLLEYLKSLPNEVDDNMMDVDNNATFNIKQHTPKQFRHYKYTLVKFLSGILSSTQLVNRIAVLNEDLLDLEPLCKSMIINTLTYIQTVSKVVDRSANSPQAQYWKVMLHHCFDIMDSINALLTREMFLLVIRGLIVHNIPTVKRKSLEILNTKLQHQPSFFYSSQDDEDVTNTEGLFALIPSLLNIIKSVEQKDVESEQELTQQTALLSLKLLIKLLASKHPDQFTPILNYVTDLMKSKIVSSNILASVVLCLAELCSKLRANAIPGLVRYMPVLIKVLKAQKRQETPGLLFMCILTAIQKIVESLPLFMSPYLEKILCELTVLSVKWPDDKLTPFEKKLESIRSNIGSMIPPRILIPIVGQTYTTLLNNEEFLAVGPLMSILAENLSHLRGAELTNHLSDLTTFFLNALQFRTDYNGLVSFEIITRVEDHLIQTLTILVLKLSETTFRPFYYRLFDWAVHNDTKSERVITFYRLSCGFAESLKGLFVLFAGHFVTNAASVLDACNTVKSDTLYFNDDESKNILLIESILSTLKSVFSYDSQHFVDKDRFETLMQPIVDQLENTLISTTVENILIPCISQFAVTTADDALWKQLNYQILLKMRHNFSQIRLAALNCLCEVARKLGEDFLPLLPETIPFLAELLEDEDEQVETRCQKVVQDLEKSLGEPLQKYF